MVETLHLTGTADIDATGNGRNNDLTGNDGANVLTGLAGNDVLDGGLGADTLIGGAGYDSYYVDNTGDTVVELDGQGSDTVTASVGFSLAGTFVETLYLTGTDNIDATGNSLDNTVFGNDGANTLIGGYGDDDLHGLAGNDTMIGGKGDDYYVVDDSGDTVIEAGGEGHDIVAAGVSFSLAGQAIEDLYLTDSGNINGTGNSLANTVYGNGGNNVLDGGYGADLLHGGAGADTFLFKTASGADTIDDFSAADGDTINLHAYTHGASANILTQSGNDVVISLGGSNTVTVQNVLISDLAGHIVW